MHAPIDSESRSSGPGETECGDEMVSGHSVFCAGLFRPEQRKPTLHLSTVTGGTNECRA
jgi:hypothetical protein